MFKELSKVELRYDAVMAVIRDGLNVSEVAEKLGVSRQSLFRWMARDEEGGLESLADRSHRPHSVPHEMAPEYEARVLEMRRLHPSWGPIRLQHQLARQIEGQPPSHMAIYRALVRDGLVDTTARSRVGFAKAVGVGFRRDRFVSGIGLKPSQQDLYVMSDSRTSITARRASMRAGIAESTPTAAMIPRHVPASASAEGAVARDP